MSAQRGQGQGTYSDVRSPTSTRTEVRSPTATRTEVRSPTRTSTWANTRGNFTSTVTGGAGAGATSVTINFPGKRAQARELGDVAAPASQYDQIEQLEEVVVTGKRPKLWPWFALAGLFVLMERKK